MTPNFIPDQGKSFIESGMTLITDPKSDKYLNMLREVSHDHLNDTKRQTELNENIDNDNN